MQKPSAEQSMNAIVGKIHEISRENTPLGVRVGIVLAEPPDIQIGIDNIILTKENLYVDQFLLIGYQRSTAGTTEMTDVDGDISIKNFSASGSYSTGGINF